MSRPSPGPFTAERALLELVSRMLAVMEAVEHPDAPDMHWTGALERAREMFEKSRFRRCAVCGCSDYDPCIGSCGWADEDLCTACAERGSPLRGCGIETVEAERDRNG